MLYSNYGYGQTDGIAKMRSEELYHNMENGCMVELSSSETSEIDEITDDWSWSRGI